MKKKQAFLLFLSIFLLLVVAILNFSVNKVTGKAPNYQIKRGYIFDRNLKPIAISLENYKAYYILKENSFLSSSDLAILKKYLGSTLNLPKKGVVLLSDDLSLDEVEKFKKEKNIIIEKSFKRKILQPYLKFLIGKTFNGYGVSGLEKVFNEHLKKGKPLILSLDLNLEKKIYNIIQEFDLPAFGIAIFNLETGELLGYLESENIKLFDNYYPLSFFNIPDKEIKNFRWVLGEKPVIKEKDMMKINAWHLAKWYMDTVCNHPITPTILYTKTKICKPNLEIFDRKEYTYTLGNIFITIAFKKNKMILTSLALTSQDAIELNEKIVNYLFSLL